MKTVSEMYLLAFSVPPLVIMVPWEKIQLQTILLIESIRLKNMKSIVDLHITV